MFKRVILLMMLLLIVQVVSAQETVDFSPLVEGNNAFAFDLYQQLAANDDGNVLYSPYSISLALAMTYAGARNETAQQIADTLRFDLSQEQIHPTFAALNAELASRAEEFADYGVDALQLNIANALWGEQTLPFNPDFVQTIDQNYGAALRPVPPGASKQKDVRYLDIHEDEELDEAQLAAWVKQAAALPGEKM